jgi:GNAT superfamily N-acetyltransferase
MGESGLAGVKREFDEWVTNCTGRGGVAIVPASWVAAAPTVNAAFSRHEDAGSSLFMNVPLSWFPLSWSVTFSASGLVYHRHAPSAKNLSGVEVYIMNMYTLPEWRGRGIATALLEKLVAFARESNYYRIRLHTYPKALRLYTRAGFVLAGDEMKLDLR